MRNDINKNSPLGQITINVLSNKPLKKPSLNNNLFTFYPLSVIYIMENKEIKRTTRPEAHDCNECQRCQKSIKYNSSNDCIECQFMFFEKHYKDFSSGNEEVDKIIKNPIYIPDNWNSQLNYYEWIPWERLSDINEIARGGFGIIYKATLIDGLIDVESIKHHGSMEYKRKRIGWAVAIKIIPTNSSEVFKECWDANPKNRPTARELTGKFMELLDLYNNHIFRLIYFGKSNILTKIAKNDSTTTKIAIHPEAVYTSRLLTAQMVNFSTGLFI
ncbi:hypothetical protein G9A89_023452 [Geosiphon pyriformis]|nr:hypothetical protein G9A89_023452 [Geosiphon pyriformis]